MYDHGDIVGVAWWIGHFHGTFLVVYVVDNQIFGVINHRVSLCESEGLRKDVLIFEQRRQ
jgi:hypothetical protein